MQCAIGGAIKSDNFFIKPDDISDFKFMPFLQLKMILGMLLWLLLWLYQVINGFKVDGNGTPTPNLCKSKVGSVCGEKKVVNFIL